MNVVYNPRPIIRIKLLCNWTTSENLCRQWRKMGNEESKIKLVWTDVPLPDYYVVINASPQGERFDLKKTILFRMEPRMELRPELWGWWANPNKKNFFYAGFHKTSHNNFEWHLSKTCTELLTMSPEKLKQGMSTVLSTRYHDVGHIKRVDFVKFLEMKGMQVDVFGDDKWQGTERAFVNHLGPLPYHCKDNALFPYKYTFNCENNSVPNYLTEKLIDGILAECLVFYSGCPNAAEHIDRRAFVYLELSNFESDYEKIKSSIANGLWEERLPFIREAKRKILMEQQFFPRLEKLIS